MHTVISDKSFAQRLLTRAGLTRRERMDIFFSSGGKYATAPIERVMRFRCSNIHQEEGRGSSSSKGNRLVEDRGHTSKPRKQMYVKRGDRKHMRSTRHQTAHVAGRDEPNDEYDDEEDPEDTDNEDLEQEALAAGGGGGSNDEGEEYEDVPVEDEWDDEEWNTVENLKDAYAAGWRAKQQSAEQRKGCGYRGQSKGKGKGSRPKETRQVDDRKKNSRCSSCKQKGHWHGDPECPNVQSGKDAPREPGTGGSSANYNTSGEGDARGGGGDSVRSHRVNWTFMEGWELLRGYASEQEESDSEESSEGEDLEVALAAVPKQPPTSRRQCWKHWLQRLMMRILNADSRRRSTRQHVMNRSGKWPRTTRGKGRARWRLS